MNEESATMEPPPVGTGAATALVNDAGHFVAVTPSFAQLLGADVAVVEGADWREYAFGKPAAGIATPTGPPAPGHVHLTAAEAPDGAGSLPCDVATLDTPFGVLTVVTARPEAGEHDGARARGQLAEAQAVARVGSWEWDIAHNHVTWSDELFRLYGREPGSLEVNHEAYLGLLPEHERERVNGIVTKAYEDGQPFTFDHDVLWADGTQRLLHARGRVILGDDGKPARMIGTAQDVTARRRAEARVQEALKEKDVLFQEIHHRVKNNLQVVASLLNMQAQGVADPNMRGVLHESRDRVRAMALVHESLNPSDEFTAIDFGQYVRRLTADIARSYNARPDGIRLEVDADSARIGVDTVVHCGLIITELVSNAFKHAFPDGGRGRIHVRARAMEGQLEMTVADNGVGRHEAGNPATMGLQLVRSLVQQAKGTVTESAENGTTFTVRLPMAGAPMGDAS